MSGTPIQILGGLSPEDFLADYWQKQPLLIRNAIADFKIPITPDELAGLACEYDVESRLILERGGPHPWALEHGPFAEQRFTELPESHWTLLVQECNKYVPELATLMERFSFIPNWRMDDVMVSYAPDQGTVGPHVDQYDVFLFQGLGKRRWQISTDPVKKDNFLPDLELNILKTFEPGEEWILDTGDMLYLPPGIAHHGVAMEKCMTYSIGFRAPSYGDIITAFTDSVASKLGDSKRYNDPDLNIQKNSGEISRASLIKIQEIIHNTLADSNTGIDSWFGRFVTESKSGDSVIEPEQKIDTDQFLKLFKDYGKLERSEFARFAFIPQDDKTLMFIDGHEYELTKEQVFAAPLLCNQRQNSYAEMADNLTHAELVKFLTELYNAGYVTFSR